MKSCRSFTPLSLACDGELPSPPLRSWTTLEVIELLAVVKHRITRLARRRGIELDRPDEEIGSEHPATIRKILDHLGLPTTIPAPFAAQSPPGDEQESFPFADLVD